MKDTKEITLSVILSANKRENPIGYKTEADFKQITNLKTRSTGKTDNGATIAAAVFPSAFLLLVRGSQELLKVPLVYIERHTIAAFQLGYPVNLENVDWQRSKIIIEDLSTVTAGQVVELTVSYLD